MIKIPFEIKICDPLNPDGPDVIYREIMKQVLYEEKFHLNKMVTKEVNRLFKKKIKLLNKPVKFKV